MNRHGDLDLSVHGHLHFNGHVDWDVHGHLASIVSMPEKATHGHLDRDGDANGHRDLHGHWLLQRCTFVLEAPAEMLE